MIEPDTILTVNVVEPGLVRAVELLSKKLGRKLKGLALIDMAYVDYAARPRDTTGLFEEIVCDFNDPDEIQEALKPYEGRLLAATARYEEAMQPFAKIIPFIPYLHNPSESSLYWATNKSQMRNRLKSYDPTLVPRYQYMEIEDIPRLAELTKDFTFPVIVKPSGLAKSLLVNRCESPQELKECLDRTFHLVFNAYDRERYPDTPSVLVEEMILGDQYSVDAYVMYDGETLCLPPVKVTTAHALGLNGFYAYETSLPSDLSDEEVVAAYQASVAAVRALNLRSTTAHIELYRTKEGWKIIELAARIGGFRDILYREVYGVEHFYNDLLVHMGIKPEIPTQQLKYAAAIKIYSDEEGIIGHIQGMEEAKKLSSIMYLHAHSNVGDMALFVMNGGDPVVDGILTNENSDQLVKDIAEVRKLVKISIEHRQEPNISPKNHNPFKKITQAFAKNQK